MTAPTIPELAKSIADTQTALNIVWTLVTGFLVMFMQAGFALVETGLVRGKNVAHTMGMNFLVYSIGIIGFWCIGFALQMGGVGAMATFGGDPSLSSEFAIHIGGKAFRHSLERRASSCRSQSTHQGWPPCSSFRWCSWTRRPRFQRELSQSGGGSFRSSFSASSLQRLSTRFLAIGFGAVVGSRRWAQTMDLGTVTLTSPEVRWCT